MPSRGLHAVADGDDDVEVVLLSAVGLSAGGMCIFCTLLSLVQFFLGKDGSDVTADHAAVPSNSWAS